MQNNGLIRKLQRGWVGIYRVCVCVCVSERERENVPCPKYNIIMQYNIVLSHSIDIAIIAIVILLSR